MNCYLRPQPEFPCLIRTEETKTRLGRYHSSSFNVADGYPVAVYIDGSFKEQLESGKTEKEIMDECIEFLNSQTEGTKKKRKPLFGHLTYHQFSFKIKEDGEYYIVALLTTNEKQNKNFWGEAKK